MQPTNIEPRAYQQAIFETAKGRNSLVVLPTGMGKTLIALLLAMHRLEKFPKSKILFLAPTRPLAEQHLEYFKKHLPDLYADMTLFTGKVKASDREELWAKSSIIFSTPQCIAHDIKAERFDLRDVSLLIEDECHRCLKNYDYTFVVKKYKEQAENPRVLGLTASPGSNPEIINSICKNLGIEAIEIRHRYSEDVKPYIQELKQEFIKVDLPDEFSKIRILFKEIYDKRIEELKNRKLFFKNAITKKTLLELQGNLQRQIATGNRHFNALRGVSVCAQAIKIGHAIELLETQSIGVLYNYLQNLFEQAKQGQSKAVTQLVNNKNFQDAYVKLLELYKAGIEHPKLSKLMEVVEREFKENKKAKLIVFSQYRDTASRICKNLNELGKEIGIKARVFVGQLKKGDTGLSQKEQQAVLNDFRLGLVNVLCATSIGEEGLDIPEVNAVIFYEPIPSAIRQIQRRGRTARLMPGKLIILMTKKTLDESYYWAAFHKERKMYGVLDTMQKQFNHQSEKKKQKTLEEFK